MSRPAAALTAACTVGRTSRSGSKITFGGLHGGGAHDPSGCRTDGGVHGGTHEPFGRITFGGVHGGVPQFTCWVIVRAFWAPSEFEYHDVVASMECVPAGTEIGGIVSVVVDPENVKSVGGTRPPL